MKPVTDVHELFRSQRAIRSFADLLVSHGVEAVWRSRYNAGSGCRSRTETVPVCPTYGWRR